MRKQTQETRKKISLALKGRKKPIRSKEHCNNLRRSLIGRVAWNKGLVGAYSEETKKKISRTLKRKGIKPPSRKGAKLSKKHIKVLKSIWINRKRSKKNRLNSSLGARKRVLNGTHNFYRGGLVSIKQQIRDCVQYKLWRETIFKRDNYTCVDCLAKNGNGKSVYLIADHIQSLASIIRLYKIKNLKDALNCDILWDINNGRTLCTECHRKTDNYGIKEYRRLEMISI